MERSPGPQGFLVIISGPSGVGKSTITNVVRERLDAALSVSMTTRPKAADDVEGEHYFFVDRGRFESAIAHRELLEHAEVYGNYYGTPRGPVLDKLAAGRIVILEIDMEGAAQVKSNLAGCFAIFIKPPSYDALLQRLRDRKREDEATIQKRFAQAKNEIEAAEAGSVYDVFIVNDDLNRAVDEAIRRIGAEVERRRAGAHS